LRDFELRHRVFLHVDTIILEKKIVTSTLAIVATCFYLKEKYAYGKLRMSLKIRLYLKFGIV
jgi:hypothetical protein